MEVKDLFRLQIVDTCSFLVIYVKTADTLNMFYYYNYMLLIKTSYTTIDPAAELPQEVGSSWCSIICSEGQRRCLL